MLKRLALMFVLSCSALPMFAAESEPTEFTDIAAALGLKPSGHSFEMEDGNGIVKQDTITWFSQMAWNNKWKIATALAAVVGGAYWTYGSGGGANNAAQPQRFVENVIIGFMWGGKRCELPAQLTSQG